MYMGPSSNGCQILSSCVGGAKKILLALMRAWHTFQSFGTAYMVEGLRTLIINFNAPSSIMECENMASNQATLELIKQRSWYKIIENGLESWFLEVGFHF